MYFNSYIFILAFLPITVLGYYLINRTKQYRAGQMWLFLASLVFIGYMNVYYIPVTLVSAFIGYLFVLGVTNKRYSAKRKKIFLIMGIVVHAGFLLYCKYMNFFLENINALLKTEFSIIEIILPLGISYYTFQQIAYLVDCYRDTSVKCSLDEYLLYITYFPKFLQGPILLHEDMLPALRDEKNKYFNVSRFSKGLYAFALGLGKKVLIADNISLIVEAGYTNLHELNSPSVILIMLGYSLQLYFDFSGYCDMAIGIGEMLQIPVPMNFNSPYKSTSITDVWNRWHMTLTRFFTRYIYFSLGGSRKGTARAYINTIIVFLISGLWHGAAWTYVLWGLMNGIAMVIAKLFQKCKIAIPKVVGWFGTYMFWVTSLMVFKANSIQEVGAVFERLLRGGFGPLHEDFYLQIEKHIEVTLLQRLDITHTLINYPDIVVIGFILLCLAGCVFMKNTQEKLAQFRFTYGKLFVTVGLLFYGILSLGSVSVFLYAVF